VRTLRQRAKAASEARGAAQAEAHAARGNADEKASLATRLQALLVAKEVEVGDVTTALVSAQAKLAAAEASKQRNEHLASEAQEAAAAAEAEAVASKAAVAAEKKRAAAAAAAAASQV